MLNPEGFRQHIRRAGERVRWFKAYPHTCYDPATNYDHQRGCEDCEFGMYYQEHALRSAVRVLLTELKERFLHPEFGVVKMGDLVCQTMPDELRLGLLDKLVLQERSLLKRERLTKGVDTFSEPYPAELVSVTAGATVYRVGTDCRLGPTAVTWMAGGNAPATNALYAVEFLYHPVFWCILGDEKPPRPLPLCTGGLTPQRVYLVRKHPGEA